MMFNSTYGIHIASDRLTAVRLKSGFSGFSVDSVRVAEITHGTLTEDLGGLKIPQGSELAFSLGADSLFQRVVVVPFTDKTSACRAAPLEAEESLPYSLEKLATHCRVLQKTEDSSRVLVVAAPLDKVEKRLGAFYELGLSPKALDADHSALCTVAKAALADAMDIAVVDLSGNHCQAVILGKFGPERFFGLSSTALSVEVIDELARLFEGAGTTTPAVTRVYLTGPDAPSADLEQWKEGLNLPVEIMPFPKKLLGNEPQAATPWPSWAIGLGLALSEAAPGKFPRVNLLSGRFGQEDSQQNLKSRLVVSGVYAAILVALLTSAVGVETVYKKRRLDSINKSVRDLFFSVAPEVKNVVDEVAQLKQRVTEQEEKARILGSLLKKEVSPLRVLKELSQRIPPGIKVEFRDFVVEPEIVRIEGETTSFDAIDKIQAKLQEYPWFSSVVVSDAKASVDQTKVIFKLTIGLGKKDEAL